MANKMQFYTQIAEDTVRQITTSREQWMAFLKAAARLYKYPYYEQIMIFAQRPEATACAEYGLWNNTMHRYVRRGAKGIALIDLEKDTPSLKYVFDVSDTGERPNSRPVKLWTMKDEYNEPILQALHSSLMSTVKGESLQAVLYAAANHLSIDYWENYRKQILAPLPQSHLDGMDVKDIKDIFRQTSTNSISYCLCSRCTENADNYFIQKDFDNIVKFNTRQAANTLACAVSTLSAQLYREIEAATRNYERTKAVPRLPKKENNTVLHQTANLEEG